ncbi:MAG: hypothetical protein IJ722_03635 [Alloprevotella sp.]|nr:hypothetical protein [Alloprevotella sp.]
MAFKHYAKLGLFLLLCCFSASIAAQGDYPLNFDPDNAVSQRANRYVRTISIGDQSIDVYPSGNPNGNNACYLDLTNQTFTVKAGATVKFVAETAGEWSHNYLYVDWDRDGQFKVDDVSAQGVIGEGQEIVTFSYWDASYSESNGYNSAGVHVEAGNKTFDCPEFTIPADASGEYRMRFKNDWGSLDPGGNPGEPRTGNNKFVVNGVSENGGVIVDVTLIVEPPIYTFKANCARGYLNGGANSLADLVGVLSADEAAEFALIPYEGTTFLYDATHKTFVCHHEADVTALGQTGNPLHCYDKDFSKIVRGVQMIEDTQIEPYPFHFEDENGNYLNMDGQRNLYFNKWLDFENGTGGNTYNVVFSEEEFDPTEAIAMLDAYFHPSATYNIVVLDAEQNERVVATAMPAGIGDVISEMPAEYKKDFCTYTVAEPLTVEEGEDNVLIVDVAYNLPFEEGKWYNMTVRGMYAVNDGNIPVQTQNTKPEATEEGGLWQFSGNPYDGVLVTNKLAGEGFTLGYESVVVERPGSDVYMKQGETRWDIAANMSGFVLRLQENNEIYLHNRNPQLATCSLTEWWDVHEDAGSTIAIQEVEVEEGPVEAVKAINLRTGEFTQSNPNKTWASKWESFDDAPHMSFYTGANNMASNADATVGAGDGLKIFDGQSGSCDYTIEVEAGYVITGYTIRGNAYSSDMTVTAGNDSYVFTSEEKSVDIAVDNAESATFNLSGVASTFLNAIITVNVKKLVTEDVTFSIYDADEMHVWTEVIPVEVGTVITELPESLKRPFCEYTYPAELTVGPEAHNTFLATVTYTLPFTTDGAPYYMTVGGKYAYINEDFAVANAAEAADEDNYKWAFTGDPYNGIMVQNVGAGVYLTNGEIAAGSWSTPLATTGDRTQWIISQNGNGFGLHRNEAEYIVLSSGTVVTHNWSGNATASEAVLMVEPASNEPVMVDVTFIVTDTEGNTLDEFTIPVENGTELTDVPEEHQRPYTTYIADPITVTADAENTFYTVAMFDEPFPVNEYVYILTEDNTVAFGDFKWEGIDTNAAIFNRALDEEAEGDLTDGFNWALDVEGTTMFHEPLFAGGRFSMHPTYIFIVSGNPYEGYTITSYNGNVLTANAIHDDTFDMDFNGFTEEGTDGTAFQILPYENITQAAPAARRAPGWVAGEYALEYDGAFVAADGMMSFFSSMETEAENATPFTFVTIDEETYEQLIEEFELVGISNAKTQEANGAIYDLQGRRVGKLQKGVNIINGQKVLVK